MSFSVGLVEEKNIFGLGKKLEFPVQYETTLLANDKLGLEKVAAIAFLARVVRTPVRETTTSLSKVFSGLNPKSSDNLIRSAEPNIASSVFSFICAISIQQKKRRAPKGARRFFFCEFT